MLVDLSSGQILFQRNPDRRFVPASITKVMTAYQAFELLEAREIQPNQTFPFSRVSFAQWGGEGSTMFINAGDNTRVSDLLLGITTVSANDASIVLAEGAGGSIQGWLDQMNATAQRLGMNNSRFGTPNGWPDEGRTFTTARDLAILGTALVTDHRDQYRRFFGHRSLTYRGITQPNHEPLTGRVAGGDGIKTGFTNEAGFGVLGSAERNGRRLMVVVAGADARSQRALAARDLIEWGFSAFDSRLLFTAGEEVGSIRVQGGSQRSVALVSPRAIAAALPLDTLDTDITARIIYDGPVRAPIAIGEQVAELEITVGEAEPSRVPLYASEAIGPAGPLARMINGVIGWFT
ncbi:MAG: D-alanyl-D-alanine carboxypeptidase [Altererythrobacter sp.]|nr:D-alanyl-D-alanine carboxypeptidase [Altererythrobacter sp.]